MEPRPTPRAPGRIPRPRFGTALRGAGGTAARRRADRIPHRPPGVLVARFHRHPRHPHPASRNRTPRRSRPRCRVTRRHRDDRGHRDRHRSGRARARARTPPGVCHRLGPLSAAVAVARANAARLGTGNVSFIVADACAALAPTHWSVIVSNPPYVAENDPHLTTGDVRFEPPEALVSGPRGLTMLETLARQGPARLARGGWLVLEHGRDQGSAVRALLSGAGLGAIETVRDLAGNERVTLGRRATAGR